MKKIIRHSLLASVMTAAGIAATATGAFAQAAPADATINFEGLVGSVCTFSNMTAGALGGNGSSMLSSRTMDGGTPGSVDLSCTGGAELSVSTPQDNGSTSNLMATANFSEASVGLGPDPDQGDVFNNSQGGGNPPAFIPGPVDETINVNMMIDNGMPIPEGAYNYNVVVTATPM